MKFLPFNLSGPWFLLVYAGFALVLIVLLRWFWRRREADRDRSIPRLTDPYLIGLLRDSPQEAIRLALISLIDRGLLMEPSGEIGLKRRADAQALVTRPFERAVLGCFSEVEVRSSTGPFGDARVAKEIDAMNRDLASQGLIIYRLKNPRWGYFLVGALLLTSVALVRIVLSGSPYTFLLIELAVALGLLLAAIHVRATGLGRRTLKHLQTLMSRLRDRASSLRAGGASSEAVMLAAVFGAQLLPASQFPGVAFVAPEKDKKSSSDGGGGCSSSSGDGSCGGGGGGGCGGGCGG